MNLFAFDNVCLEFGDQPLLVDAGFSMEPGERVCIVELDRGRITSWPGDYQAYLKRKEQCLQSEADQNREFDKKLAQEEAWLRQGLKARRKASCNRLSQRVPVQPQARHEPHQVAVGRRNQPDHPGKTVHPAHQPAGTRRTHQ